MSHFETSTRSATVRSIVSLSLALVINVAILSGIHGLAKPVAPDAFLAKAVPAKVSV